MRISGIKTLPADSGYLTQKQYTKGEVEFVNCPFCGSNEYKTISIERSVLGIVRCQACGLIYVNPRLKSPERIYWGDGGGYYEEARLIFSGEMPHHRDRNYLEDLRLIRKFKPEGNFLDIGTNAGFFLRLARQNSAWNTYGVEPSKPLSDLARKYFGLNIKNVFLEEADFPDAFFDIVTMTDVFEHIINPIALLKAIGRIIKEDGILFIKVPNGLFNITKLRLARLVGASGQYDIFDSYEHLIHYSHDSLSKMLKKGGFSPIYRGIGKPIHTPLWHKYTGHYYQYPMPWVLDCKNHILREAFYAAGLAEYAIRGFKAGFLAPNITVIARKAK